MKYEVFVTADAERDIEEIYDFLAENRSLDDAEYVRTRLLEVVDRLEQFPNRGTYPDDLSELGATAFREIFFKPYRVIYRILDKRVYIYVVTDGRRDIRSLLAKRLLH